MSKVDIYMPLYIGDYLKCTRRLTTEQHGAYLLLIMDYWQNGSLPDDDRILARIAGLSDDAWSNASSILRAFFKQSKNGTLIHTRIDKELEEAKSKKAKSTERAIKAAVSRWSQKEPDATSNAISIQQAMLEQCPSPSPSYKENICTFIKRFNESTGKSFRVLSKKTQSQLNARLKEGFTEDEIIQAAVNCSRDQYHIENPKYLTPEFITRADKLEKYLGQKVQVDGIKRFIPNGRYVTGEDLCDGLTYSQHIAKYGDPSK